MDYFQGCIACLVVAIVIFCVIAFLVWKSDCIKSWLNNDSNANTIVNRSAVTSATEANESQLVANQNQVPVQVKTVTYPDGGQQITVVATEENNTSTSKIENMTTNTTISEDECKELRKKFAAEKKDASDMERMRLLLQKMENEKYKPTEDEINDLIAAKKHAENVDYALYLLALIEKNQKEEYKKPLYAIVDEVVERKFEEERKAKEKENLREGTTLLCKEVHVINKEKP